MDPNYHYTMTIDKMLERLQSYKEKYGGNTEVLIHGKLFDVQFPKPIESLSTAKLYPSSKEIMILIS